MYVYTFVNLIQTMALALLPLASTSPLQHAEKRDPLLPVRGLPSILPTSALPSISLPLTIPLPTSLPTISAAGASISLPTSLPIPTTFATPAISVPGLTQIPTCLPFPLPTPNAPLTPELSGLPIGIQYLIYLYSIQFTRQAEELGVALQSALASAGLGGVALPTQTPAL